MTTNMTFTSDVIIVGGGPTGLMLAGELALAGARATLLERRVERVKQSRALSMHIRSVEILGLRGIADRFISRGMPRPTSHFAQLHTRLDFTHLNSKVAFGLLLPQAVTEQLLEEWALELGVRILRGWNVETIQDGGDAVRVCGTNPQGAFELASAYLVGADGPRSSVREQCNIGFSGSDTDQTYYFGDVYLEGPGVPEAGRFAVHSEAGGVEAFPIADGQHRIIFIDPARFSVPLSTAVTLEEMQDGVRRIFGPGVSLRDPSWMSRFGNATRLADRYRKGRVFLAGDAAHIHLPAGGQGMNTGLQDALNLGWKLAGTLRGWAPASLLESYETERRPVGERLMDNTRAQEAILSCPGQRGVALRAIMNELLELPAVNRFLAERVTGLDIGYPDPLLPDHTLGDARWAGRRLPDESLSLPDGTTTSLYALMHRGDWVDLHIDTQAASPVPAGIDPKWVRTVKATPLEESSSLQHLAAALIRPDGHVAFAKTPGAV